MVHIRVNIPQLFLDEKYEQLQTLQSVGLNSGNCVFWHATMTLLHAHNNQLSSLPIENVSNQQIRDTDLIVLALANGIQNATSVINYISMLNNTLKVFSKPYNILSIGAQAPLNSSLTLNSSAQEAVNTLITGANKTFLRGEHTYETLVRNNIDTTKCEVLGCPSLTLLQSIPQGERMGLRRLPTMYSNLSQLRVCVCLPNKGQSNKLQLTWLRTILQQASLLTNVYTLIQDEGKGTMAPNHVYFVDPVKRTSFLKTMHFCIGTRIHGAVAGLIACVPSMCITIDSRTQELCKTMHIPSVSVSEAKVFAETHLCVHPLQFLLSLFTQFYDASLVNLMYAHLMKQEKAYADALQHKALYCTSI